ncbi:MmgE/PrpD [Rubrobacter xylanophilus DSM 9941]|uniref:MmgE/PrpD n=1 Tax=Rubrobacter xylanophilus (strain DSM 9941 / JCM 11954 / NBRC 16129 / PRD-1) TaxID=266117 RepID=Q1AZ34_RUBXD|nr:MmgE/PrpD family protein [Rubrobacter xylanophilus]ABG03344.1 MmgE/PrpD [Rubrobacter xylanophilus DSM 9941]
MSGRTVLQEVSRFAARVRDEGIPPELLRDARRRVTDIVGIALAASAMEPARIVGEVVDAWGGAGQASAVGRGRRYPAASAALLNGTLAHALDYDDTHLPSVLHPSAAVVPAALAAAEAAGAAGPQLLAAVAAGDELVVRVGMAGYDAKLGNSVFFEKGMHATSIAGTLGAALAAAMVYGLGEEEIGHAVAIAASMGAGIIEANRTGGTVKRVHCGWAAHAGVTAAELARSGLTGPPTVFEGRFGFLRAYLDDRAHPDAILRGLGEEWELPRIFFKPYPANHFTHAGIDAALRLREEGLDVREVEAIELGVASPTLRTIAEPPEEKARPKSGYAAQFSGPFAVATALVGGGGLGVSLEDFTDEAVRDRLKLDLASRVRCVADEECDRIFPNQFPAVLRVRLRSGEVREARVLHNRGGPENPLSDEELEVKFRANAGRALSEERVGELWEALRSLGEADALEGITALVRESRPA